MYQVKNITKDQVIKSYKTRAAARAALTRMIDACPGIVSRESSDAVSVFSALRTSEDNIYERIEIVAPDGCIDTESIQD